MSTSKFTKAERYQLIMECRASGLSDYAWCKQNDIQPGTFYGWIKQFRREACEIPASSSKAIESVNSIQQEVVRLDFQPGISHNSYDYPQQNACIDSHETAQPTITLKVGSIDIGITNDVDPSLLTALLQSLGGATYVG